jgi:TonB-linked SusC/RagA family outer membrane protein
MYLTALCKSRYWGYKKSLKHWDKTNTLLHSNKTIILAMKLTAILLLTACLQVSAKTYSQVITLNLQNAPLDKVVQEIKRQTKMHFFYEEGLFENAKPVTISVNKSNLKEVLELSFKDQPFDYKIDGNTVFIRKKNVQETHQVNKDPLIDIHGRVVNDKGEPVLASISVKGSTKGTTTNKDGWFVLPGIEENAILIISGVGIETTEVRADKTLLNVIVKISVRPLDEVQMIAYGTTTKRFYTGNVSTVKSNEIQSQPVNNPLLALEGQMSGVFISQTTGVAGAAINVQIRGENSIANKNWPLYIIDGVPYSSQLLPNLGSSILQQANSDFSIGAGNPLSFINPLDIESISVLKDADATAIYGSRGANGVVLINTKKGVQGKTKVGINISTGFAKVAKKLDLMNTQEYLSMRREAFNNDRVIPSIFNAPDLMVWDTTRYTDWQAKLIGGTAHITNIQSSISGGTTNTQFLIDGNYHKETTVYPGDYSDQKASFLINLNNISSNGKFKTSFSSSFVYDDNKIPSSDLTSVTSNLAPDAPEVYNSDGTLNWANSSWTNPFSLLKRFYNARTSNLVSNLTLDYQIFKNLELSGNFGYTNMQVNEISTSPISSLNPIIYPQTGSASFSNNSIHSWIMEPQIKYKSIFRNNKLDVLIGATFQRNNSSGQIFSVSGYTSDALLENPQAGTDPTFQTPTQAIYKYNAVFGRLTYSLANKYIVNINARRDGSSRFGGNNKFHNFGSLGASWIFSQENFVHQIIPFLSFGKIRGSYGTTGNDQIPDYQYYDLFLTNQYTYQGIVGLTPSRIYNPNLKWEETKKLEFAVDLGVFDDRILANVAYYRNKSDNQLISYLLPTVTGFSSIFDNFQATVQNDGWEIGINTMNIKSRNFNWSSSFNLTVPRNKLVSFPNINNTSYGSSLIVGESIKITKVYHLVRINDTTGIYQFADAKGNVTNTPSPTLDKITHINTSPEYYGGLLNNFSFKHIELSFLIQFTKQLGTNPLFQKAIAPGYFSSNVLRDNLNRWQAPGGEYNVEKYTQSFASRTITAYRSARQSDHSYSDASYIRIKNVAVSYSLSDKLLKKLKVNMCKIYLQSQNLFTITKYKGLDPENRDIGILPPLRVITGGIEVSL